MFLKTIELQKITRDGENVEKLELLYTAAGNEEWYGHCGKQFEVSLQS